MIVAVAGVAGSGKSLVGSHLSTRGFRVVSIADLPKRFVAQALGFTERQLFGPSSARSEPHPTIKRADGQPLTARYALQGLATWAMDACPGVWIEHALRSAGTDDVVICDVRYRHELAAIKRAGGYLIRRRSDKPSTDTHSSECDLLDVPDSEFHAVLGHYPDKAHLYQALDVILAGWMSEAAQ